MVEKQIEKYNVYFNSVIKNSLSKAFIEKYLFYNGFHDWDVISIENNVLTYERPKKDLTITLFNYSKKTVKKIHYNGVRVFRTNFNEVHFQQWSYDGYSIDEFFRFDNGLFSHEVFFPSGSSYYVEFESVKII